VAAVPVSAFYVADAPTNFVRFCFCKKDEVIDGALERLGNWVRKQKASGASASLDAAPAGGN
jgi:aspartate/methionine/tyrosine aminotransferase